MTPEQVRATAPENPPVGVTVTVELPLVAGWMTVTGVAARVKAGVAAGVTVREMFAVVLTVFAASAAVTMTA